MAVSGANFGVAETGTLCVVESEGNGRMCTTLPPVLVTILGIEKLVPTLRRPRGLPAAAAALVDRRADEPVHLALDRRHRAATARRSSTSSCSTPAARACCADEVGRQALHCIRCSACLNVCPVYSRTGGHAYGSVYPGPIGAILTPQLIGDRAGAARCRSPRASAAPATRSARSRSTSRRCCCTCAARPSQRRGDRRERLAMTAARLGLRAAGAASRSPSGSAGSRSARSSATGRSAGCRGRSPAGRARRDLRPLAGESFRDWWRRRP